MVGGDGGDDAPHERDVGGDAVGERDDEAVLGGADLEAAHGADLLARRVTHLEADEVLLVEGVVLGLRVGLGQHETGASQALGAGAVGDLLEREQPDAAVHPGRGHGERGRHPGPRLGLGRDDGADGEAGLGVVGVELDGHLSQQAVGFADAGEHDVHGPNPLSSGGRRRPLVERW